MATPPFIGVYASSYDPYQKGSGPTVPQLTAPTGLTQTASTASSITLQGDREANAAGYRFQLAQNAAFTQGVKTSPTVAQTSGTAVVYQFTNLPNAAATYYTRVLALGDGTTYADSPYSAAVQVSTAPTATTGLHILVTPIGTSLGKGYNKAYTGNAKNEDPAGDFKVTLPPVLAGDGNFYTVLNLCRSGEAGREWLANNADADLQLVANELAANPYNLWIAPIDHIINDAVKLLNGVQATGAQVSGTLRQVHQKVLAFGVSQNIPTQTIAVTSSTLFSNAAYANQPAGIYATAADASDVRATLEDGDARTMAYAYNSYGASDIAVLGDFGPFNYHSSSTPNPTFQLPDDLHETIEGEKQRALVIGTVVKRVAAGGTPRAAVPYVPPTPVYTGMTDGEVVENDVNNPNKISYFSNGTQGWQRQANPNDGTVSGATVEYLFPGNGGGFEERFNTNYLTLFITCSAAQQQYRPTKCYLTLDGVRQPGFFSQRFLNPVDPNDPTPYPYYTTPNMGPGNHTLRLETDGSEALYLLNDRQWAHDAP